MTTQTPPSPTLKKDDFISDQMVRWCPGCGDYAILSAVQKVCPDLGVPKENFVFVSGIGCSSRFPYYMNTYGFHTIHGRSPAVATGIKIANPDLDVWVISGDGDALSIGGNHFLHVIRRNININYLIFNNRIYGLTKGQYSPTSEQGKVTKSTPFGSLEKPCDPISLALSAGATFVARTIDKDIRGMQETFKMGHKHQGTSVIEIYQNCNIFNDGAFDQYTDRKIKSNNILILEEGKPLIFGEQLDKGIRLTPDTMEVEIVSLADGKYSEKDLLVHHSKKTTTLQAHIYGLMSMREDLPTPFGVFYQSPKEELPYEERKRQRLRKIVSENKIPFNEVLKGKNYWTVD